MGLSQNSSYSLLSQSIGSYTIDKDFKSSSEGIIKSTGETTIKPDYVIEKGEL